MNHEHAGVVGEAGYPGGASRDDEDRYLQGPTRMFWALVDVTGEPASAREPEPS
jgi:hypothetical protein